MFTLRIGGNQSTIIASIARDCRQIYQRKQWESFANENDYSVLPSDLVHVADWTAQRTADGRKPGTIRLWLAAVSAEHRQANLTNLTEHAGVRATV